MTAGRQIITVKKDWGTPKIYVNAVLQVFDGTISLDPCSSKYSIVNAQVEYVLPIDGLKESWDYPKIYVNPPYGIDKERGTRISDWLRRCAESHLNFGSEIQSLIPVATNTMHWKEYVFGSAESICFLHDTRLKFLLDGKEEGNGAPMACSMVYYGNHPDKFSKVFKNYGNVVDIHDLKS